MTKFFSQAVHTHTHTHSANDKSGNEKSLPEKNGCYTEFVHVFCLCVCVTWETAKKVNDNAVNEEEETVETTVTSATSAVLLC